VDLDGELSAFLHSIQEIKSIRDSVGQLPDKLKENEAEIERQKVKIENMLSSTSNLLITFEEQAKGLFFDLEKKTDKLVVDVKTSTSELRDIFESNSARLREEQKEKLEKVVTAYEQTALSIESVKNKITLHEQSITALQNNYAELMKIFERSELSFRVVTKSLSDLQNKPYDAELKVKAIEDKLKNMFLTKLERQRNVILAMLFILTAGIIFLVFYLR
jgi:chromosome segregation ATPase